MSAQRRTQIIVVGGALAIASAAYGLGTQAGGGNAVADNSPDGERGARVMLAPGGPCGPRELADELGVDESKLEAALRDFREEHANGVRSGFAEDLAGALGISQDKVSAALQKLGKRREDRFEERRDFRLDGRPPGALPSPPRGMRFHFGAPLRGLAEELGVTRSELRDALDKIGRRSADRIEQQNDELAQFLADRLDLDVDKVRKALPKLAPGLRSGHPPGLPDHPPAP
jgi:hypothetical protein